MSSVIRASTPPTEKFMKYGKESIIIFLAVGIHRMKLKTTLLKLSESDGHA